MWYGDPYGKGGWWGWGWYCSGWAEYWLCWTASPLCEGPKVVEKHPLPIFHGPHFWTMSQKAAFHGATPPMGFAPEGFLFLFST